MCVIKDTLSVHSPVKGACWLGPVHEGTEIAQLKAEVAQLSSRLALMDERMARLEGL